MSASEGSFLPNIKGEHSLSLLQILQSPSFIHSLSFALQINFMYFHAGRVIRTDGWQSLLASCPDIANSVVRRLSEFHDESVSARD